MDKTGVKPPKSDFRRWVRLAQDSSSCCSGRGIVKQEKAPPSQCATKASVL